MCATIGAMAQAPDGTSYAETNCVAFDAGVIRVNADAWISSPSDELLRVGALVESDASVAVGDAAREAYASVLVVNQADREVNLAGVSVQYEFSRRDDFSQFEFTCWGMQVVSPSGARRPVDCSEVSFEMNDVGPRVSFKSIALNVGEFLAGGYSNFLFSFRDAQTRVLDGARLIARPAFCDASLIETTSNVDASAATSTTFGWNPNENVVLSVCPSLLDVVFSTMSSSVSDDETVTEISGIIGHRSCSSLDLSKMAFAIDLGGEYDSSALSVKCEGLQLVYPISSMMGETRVECAPSITERGVELRFGDGLTLCPGCFIVGGPNDVILELSYDDNRSFTSTTLSPEGLRRPFCSGYSTDDVDLVRPCGDVQNVEYGGTPLTEGLFLVSSPEACCLACQEEPSCNVWTFCTADDGCGRSEFVFSYSECTLKYLVPELLREDEIPGERGEDVTYISGALTYKDATPYPYDTSETRRECRAEEQTNYDGIQLSIVNAVSWGACCDACFADPSCSVFTFCGDEAGCDDGEFGYQSCILKIFIVGSDPRNPPTIERGDSVRWTGGILADRIQDPEPSLDGCQIEPRANYKGHPLNTGSKLVVDSEEECCTECKRERKCNAWVFCAVADGCSNGYYNYSFGECWLKSLSKDDIAAVPIPAWERGETVPWTSGIVVKTISPPTSTPVPSPPVSPPSPSPSPSPSPPPLPSPPAPSPSPPPPSPPPPSPPPLPICLQLVQDLRERCSPFFTVENEGLDSACCGIVREMNNNECFCEESTLAELGDTIRVIELTTPTLCESGFSITSGISCFPSPPPPPPSPFPPPPSPPPPSPSPPPPSPSPPPPSPSPSPPPPSPPPPSPSPPPPSPPPPSPPPPPPANKCPILSIVGGPNPVQNEVLIDSLYVDAGATAKDDIDGDISESIVVDTSAVDTSRVGTYSVTYRVKDSGGCEVTAERLVRVIALVPTSDLTQLTSLCVSNVRRVEELCAGYDSLTTTGPNPVSFPSCCVAVSDMDEAGCFCVPEVVREFQDAKPSIEELASFTPLACGYRIKHGPVCSDQQLLTQFLREPTGVPEVTIEAGKWREIVDEGGALREDVGCSDVLLVTQKYCGEVQRNDGFAPKVSDFVPCCATASRLFNDTCLCESGLDLITDDNVEFVRELVGFAPLGCGLNFTSACPELATAIGLDVVMPPARNETNETVPVGPDLPVTRPIEGYGVVVENGVPLPADAPGSSACDAIRELRNFLVVSSRPGTTEYRIAGAVGCCTNKTINIPEVSVLVGYRPRDVDSNAFVNELPSAPVVECSGITLISPSGEVLDDALCDRVTIKELDGGFEITLRDVEICPDCAIAGRARDGTLFTITHDSTATLDDFTPVVRALQCDTSGSWADALPQTDSRRRKLLQFFGGIPFFPDYVRDRPDVTRPSVQNLAGFNLTQYARPFRDGDERASTVDGDDEDEYGFDDIEVQNCPSIIGRVSSSLRWFGKRVQSEGTDWRTSPFDGYDFAGRIGIDDQDPLTLMDVTIPIVLSAWVNDIDGTWREVENPIEEYQIECFASVRGPERFDSRPCAGLSFYMASYSPDGVFDENPERTLPKVTLLEISMSNVTLCSGCSIEGFGQNGTLFRVTSRSGAALDYIGPSVGNPTCKRDSGGVLIAPLIPEVEPPAPADSSPVVDASSCNGEKGLNLKGILLRDGSKFILDTEEECCLACLNTDGCDIWVYCTGDCVDFAYHSCWLKRAIGGGFSAERGPTDVDAWDRGDEVPWTSGWFERSKAIPPPPSSSPPPPSTRPPSPPIARPPAPPATVPDSATYFTLQPGVSVQIPASFITVIPGATLPNASAPVPEPTAPAPSEGPIERPLERACTASDARACPTDSLPERLRELDVRVSFQLIRVADAESQAVVTGTAINFGRTSDRVCLTGVSLTLPFERRVIDPTTNVATTAPALDFVVECIFVGVRTRDGPPGEEENGCDAYATAQVTDEGVQIVFRELSLCPECWIVGGPSNAIFALTHVREWPLELAEPTVAVQNVINEDSATCAPQ